MRYSAIVVLAVIWQLSTLSPAIAAEGTSIRVPSPETVLDGLRASHPRLILTSERLNELKNQAKSDSLLQRYVSQALDEAKDDLSKSLLVHKLQGPRLLSVSRECMARVYSLGLAWRWTGEEKYAVRLKENLMAVCAFKDWNPSHFLDTAEMSHAVGVGYDWLYRHLTEDERQTIRRGLIELGLNQGVKGYPDFDPDGRFQNATASRHSYWWATAVNNWNQVCNMGLTIGALAIAETHPEYAQTIIPGAMQGLPRAMVDYAPDGSWKEGPGYWNYATCYTVYGLAALETALGRDFGVSECEGFSVTGFTPIHQTGPFGWMNNYADAGQRSVYKAPSIQFWLARRFNQPDLATIQHRQLEKYSARAWDVIWYQPPTNRPVTLPLDTHLRGAVPVVNMRSAWDDPNATFVSVKAGFNQVNHGHLDLGNFVLDALGERWALDLGSDDYNLPGYWDGGKQDGKRWQYYRLNTFSHNVPVFDGKDQNVRAVATITDFKTGDDQGEATIDLTDAYKDFTEKVTRRVELKRTHPSPVTVHDTFHLKAPCAIEWGLTTAATIDIDGPTATLKQKGRQMKVTFEAPNGARWTTRNPPEQPPQTHSNEGFRRLILALDKEQTAAKQIEIRVTFTPVE